MRRSRPALRIAEPWPNQSRVSVCGTGEAAAGLADRSAASAAPVAASTIRATDKARRWGKRRKSPVLEGGFVAERSLRGNHWIRTKRETSAAERDKRQPSANATWTRIV